MKYLSTAAVLAAMIAVSASAGAGDSHPVVVELYTSQGCSACPPADALLGKLAQHAHNNGVIAMSLPITYWDMLGWKDTLANEANTRRQKAYAATMGHGGVYTPQIIVNGVTDVVGSREDKVEEAIEAAAEARDSAGAAIERAADQQMDMGDSDKTNTAQALASRRQKTAALFVHAAWSVDVGLSETPKKLHIAIAAAPRMLKYSGLNASIWMFNLRSSATVHIEAGENRGHVATYRNVVVGPIKELGKWRGEAVALDIPQADEPSHDGVVIVVQQGGYGRVIGAAYLGHADYYALQ